MKKMFKFLLTAVFAILTIVQTFGQVNGPAVAPAVSTAEAPVWYFIESASDGSFTYSGFTGDFRGNVMISPASAGKIIHNKLSTAPTINHALWQLIDVAGTTLLKNKATGLYMNGSYNVGATTTGNGFTASVIAGNQYKLITADVTSYTNAWKNNLCDRINTGLLANSMQAWYFITYSPLTASIASAQSVLATTRTGSSPGQYTAATRQILQDAINAAIVARDNGNSSDDDAAITTLNAAVTTYQSSKNTLKISDASNQYWYWIKGLRGITATALYAENMGNGLQILNKDKVQKDEQLWKIVVNGSGYALVNKKNGQYMNTAIANNTILLASTTAPASALYFTKSTYATDAVNFIDYFLVENTTTSATATFRMHAGASTHNWGLMNYTGGISDNCSFQFLMYDPNDVLSSAILDNETQYAKSIVGTNPGTFTTANKATYRAAIDAAITVNNNATSTAEQKTAAVVSLETARTTFLATRNTIKLSTAGNETWYYIVSANATYSSGQVMTNQNNTAGTTILYAAKSLDPNKLWKFTDAGNGKVAISNLASSLYISATPKTSGTTATAVGFNVTWLDEAQFLFNADGQTYLHAQEDGAVIVTWGTSTLSSASAWKLDELPAASVNQPVVINSAVLNQGTFTTTGIGNANHGLAYVAVSTTGLSGTAVLKSVTVDLTGTNNVAAVKNLKLYNTGSSTRLNPATHAIVAQIDNPTSATNAIVMTLNSPLTLPLGTTNFYLAADVAETANEGDVLDNRVLSVNYTYKTNRDTVINLTTKTTPHASTVFLKKTVVIASGDYGSVSYRIPAITTAADGSLVTLTDKRKYNYGDLPGDIDVVARRSTDGGKTWSEPVTVARGTGTGKGFGDALIIRAQSGKLVALMVGGAGLWGSTPAVPQRTYMSTSSDNGITWTAVRDITAQIYGPDCTNATRRTTWKGVFFGSGHGLCTRSGRLMGVLTVNEEGMGGLQDYAVYSDDEGETWTISTRAIVGGDEAKVVELDNGDILMSSRTGGNRLWAKSTDGGATWGAKNSWSQVWGTACDADILRYTSTKDGFNKSRLLHTLPNASDRSNLSMWISYDEGATWGTRKTICPASSAYSSFTILPDGTIGVYFEEDYSNLITMTFINFSLNWLTSGADTYTTPQTTVSVNTKAPFKAFSADGKIKVTGTDKPYRIFSVNGHEMKADTSLQQGVYLVKVEDYSVKVCVK